jgi:hypothetical protein
MSEIIKDGLEIFGRRRKSSALLKDLILNPLNSNKDIILLSCEGSSSIRNIVIFLWF